MVILRKVRNGRVKIKGNWYYLNERHMKYDGRFEKEWWAFGVYKNESKFVALWGSEAMFKAENDDDYSEAWDNNKSCVNGVFVWECWEQKI